MTGDCERERRCVVVGDGGEKMRVKIVGFWVFPIVRFRFFRARGFFVPNG